MQQIVSYINPQMIFYIIKWTALFFGVSLVILFICRTLKLFVRKHRILNKVTKLYYIYIPVVITICAAAFFTANYAKVQALRLVEHSRPAIVEASASYISSLNEYILKESANNYDNLSLTTYKNIITTYVKERPFFPAAEGAVSYIPEGVRSWFSATLADVLIDNVNKALSKYSKLDAATVKEFWSTDLKELMSGGFVSNILKAQVEGQVWRIQKRILIALCLLLLIPVAETVFSKIRERKQAQSE